MGLKGKVAIVTGSASGLGKAMLTRMAQEGASVVVADVNAEGIKGVVSEIEKSGAAAMGFKVDVTKRPEVKDLMAATVQRFSRIDILVNNAGVTRHRAYLEMTDEDWDFVLAVDLKGVFNCIQAAAPYFMQQRYGKIVNISSSSGTGASPHATKGFAGNANYAAAKAGVIQLTKTFARELGPYNVNVNAIAPGFILTPLTYTSRSQAEVEEHIAVRTKLAVMNRPGYPEDIANVALFLSTDESSFISGQLICVDGGRTDRM